MNLHEIIGKIHAKCQVFSAKVYKKVIYYGIIPNYIPKYSKSVINSTIIRIYTELHTKIWHKVQ
jgi:hypothetical protein